MSFAEVLFFSCFGGLFFAAMVIGIYEMVKDHFRKIKRG